MIIAFLWHPRYSVASSDQNVLSDYFRGGGLYVLWSYKQPKENNFTILAIDGYFPAWLIN